MVTAHTLRRSIIVAFAALGLALSLTSTASASEPTIPDDVVVVSSTVLGSGSFAMTATNVGDVDVDLDLAAPGLVSSVTVDSGSYDGRWTIIALAPGATSTMLGLFLQPL